MANYILKISGAGNRFLLVDKQNFNLNSHPPYWKKESYKTDYCFEDFLKLNKTNISTRKSFIKKLCSTNSLSLADGLILLKKRDNHSIYCDFYNKDGSKAEMCGNAVCCLSTYAYWQSIPLKTIYLGKIKVSCAKKGGVIFKLSDKSISNLKFNKKDSFDFINTGVPHGVIECDKLDFSNKKHLKNLAKKLRFKNIKKHKGMNVSFYQVIQEKQLKAVTYERGVEDWTLACGTGALAVSLVYLSKHSIKNKPDVFVKMPGGKLRVQTKLHLALFSPVKRGF